MEVDSNDDGYKNAFNSDFVNQHIEIDQEGKQNLQGNQSLFLN